MKNISNSILSLSLLIISLFSFPIQSFSIVSTDSNNILLVSQSKNIINYERSQPSSIDNPLEDPNFNVMRTSDTDSSIATYIVIGLLLIATIIPLATWWYFSK